MVVVIGLPEAWFALLVGMTSGGTQGTAPPPRFEDYPVGKIYEGKPAWSKLESAAARLYRTRIREGVEKGWGVYGGDSQTDRLERAERPGANFAGHYIVIRWGCGSPCIQMAIVDAETGTVYSPPITAQGSRGFVLPLLTLGNRVSRTAIVDYRVDSRLMILRATPIQSERHPSYEYYFLLEQGRWKLLRRVRLSDVD
jgi:hypothetical protein